MTNRTATAAVLTAAALGTGLAAAPASAGGIGDFLSPAFGTSCANHRTGGYATGSTTHGTGTVNGNLAGLPLGSALNQCGGADAPLTSQACGVALALADRPILSGSEFEVSPTLEDTLQKCAAAGLLM
ncbi:hypothetical protein [Streptomyces sp. H72]